MILTDAELAVLASDVQNIGIFFRLDTATIVRIWLGFGSIQPGVNVLDAVGAEYIGFGELREIPNLKQLLNGAAERIEITLSGVSGAVLQIAAQNDAAAVKGKAVHVGFAVMGSDWSLIGPIRWCGNYIADYLSIKQDLVGSSKDQIVRTISLSCGSTFTARRRPNYSFFSNRDQQARSSGDRFCERTAVYANGFNKAWPTFP